MFPSGLPAAEGPLSKAFASKGSDHRHSAVNVQRMSWDISGRIAGQEDRASSHFLGRSEAPCRNARKDRLTLLVVQFVGHCRGNKARRDGVDGDVVAG